MGSWVVSTHEPILFVKMESPENALVRERLLDEIQWAFAGVVLGNGMSLSQSEVTDNYGREITERGYGYGRELSNREYAELRHRDLTDDWAAIPHRELERIAFAFMDAEAVRYYLPALMVSALTRGDSPDWTWTTLICFLAEPGDRAALLSDHQVKAVVRFIRELPEVLDVDCEDTKRLHRAAKHWC